MSEFHFIRPWWLLSIIVLFIALHLLKRFRISQSGWQQLLPEHLSKVLIEGKQSSQSFSLILPTLIGLLSIIALAGPTWQKLPQPVFQTQQGSVLIMDMSYSMYSTDISPNRLIRARYKANDLLSGLNEGEMGLIAYAGDAFSISPLTKDINNIKLLLASLTPEIMPEFGSNPLAALTLADEMLTNAGHANGHIYWFTDGIENSDVQDITDWSRSHPHRLNILGIGTKSGAPIKLPNGELLKDSTGAIVVPKLPESTLYGSAQRGRGVYQTISNNSADINTLIKVAKNKEFNALENESIKQEQTADDLIRGDQWQEVGPWLVVLVLPFVLFYFRRGTLLAVLVAGSYFPAPPVYANVWQDLWKTADQQAQAKFNDESFNEAAEQFKNNEWQGSAHYKAGDYEAALKSFQKSDSANAHYNQGNSYAQLQQLDKAIAAYKKALEKDPTLMQAKQNKSLLEQMKKQQEQKQQQGDNSQENQDQDQQDQQNENQEGQDQEGKNQQEQNDSQQSDQQKQNQQQGEQDDSQSEQSSEQSQSEQEQEKEQSKDGQSQEEKDKAEQEQQEKAQQAKADESDENIDDAKKTSAQLAQEKLDQETEQKHQQLLNKVTNDPYLLLRNKMQIEYQKRRHEQSRTGVKKKW